MEPTKSTKQTKIVKDKDSTPSTRKRFVEKNSTLVREFDKYILEHPEFSDKLPNNALVVMQINGDEEFNYWARETAQRVAEKDTPVVYVTITELKPVRSRIEKLKLELVA